jgi:hypothetical protein
LVAARFLAPLWVQVALPLERLLGLLVLAVLLGHLG